MSDDDSPMTGVDAATGGEKELDVPVAGASEEGCSTLAVAIGDRKSGRSSGGRRLLVESVGGWHSISLSDIQRGG